MGHQDAVGPRDRYQFAVGIDGDIGPDVGVKWTRLGKVTACPHRIDFN